MGYEYKIGLASDSLTLLAELTPPIPAPSASITPSVGSITLGDGTERAIGAPMSAWHWGFLTSDQRDALKVFCPGKSAELFIRTIMPDGSWATFECVMIWPQNETRQATRVVDITIEFRQMVEQPEEP